MKNVLLLLLVIVPTFFGANASAAVPPQLKGLDAYVHKVMKHAGMFSMAWLTDDGGCVAKLPPLEFKLSGNN